MKKIDIVTGCDTGIGYELIKYYIDDNRPVIYSYINKDPYKGVKNCYGFKLDLRNEDEIVSFFNNSIDVINNNSFKIGTLINNSAIGLGGPVENTSLNIYRDVMEVNYFGLISITQKFIKKIIEDRGNIIIHGSMGGRISLPFLSPYSTTKYALEALCDSLRRELYPFNVQVCILETGGVATPIWTRVKDMDFSFIDKKYEKYSNRFLKNFVGSANRSLKPSIASQKIYKLLNRKKLPYRYRIAENRLKNYIPLILPTRVLDWIFRKMLGM